MGSPRHYIFDSALREEEEAIVSVSILRLRPFYYVFNKTIAGTEKVTPIPDSPYPLPLAFLESNVTDDRFISIMTQDYKPGFEGIKMAHPSAKDGGKQSPYGLV